MNANSTNNNRTHSSSTKGREMIPPAQDTSLPNMLTRQAWVAAINQNEDDDDSYRSGDSESLGRSKRKTNHGGWNDRPNKKSIKSASVFREDFNNEDDLEYRTAHGNSHFVKRGAQPNSNLQGKNRSEGSVYSDDSSRDLTN